jgi:DNA-binding transcriptional MerR regulator
MASVTFDTLKFVERLRAAGVPEEQAKAMAEAQHEAFSQSVDVSLATKSDILRIEKELVDIKAEQKIMRWMLGFLLAGMLALLFKAFG